MKPASSSGKTSAGQSRARDRMTVRRPVVSRFVTARPSGVTDPLRRPVPVCPAQDSGAVPGVHPVSHHLPGRITTLYRQPP